MAIYSKTLLQIVESVARLLHDYKEGTATGTGSTTTLVDNLRNEEDDYFQSANAEVYISGGTYVGTTRDISDFINTSGTITWSEVLAGATSTGDTYTIHEKFKRADIVDAINLAIDMVAEEVHIWKVDETSTTLVAGTFEYNIPSGFMYINKLTMADADGAFYDDDEIPANQWIILHASTPQIKLLRFPPDGKYTSHWYGDFWSDAEMTASRKIRIEGVGSPDVLSADSSVCPMSPAYLAFQAAALLHMSRIRRADNDPDEHAVQYQLLQRRADVERAKIISCMLPVSSKRVRE